MRLFRLLLLTSLLLLTACGDDWTTITDDDLGLALEHPAAWTASDAPGGLLLGSDDAVIAALEADEIIDGGAAAITVESMADLPPDVDAVTLVSLLLDNFGDLGGGRWQLDGGIDDVTVDGVTGAQATLRNSVAAEGGWVTVRALTGDTLAIFIILIDTTPDGTHQESLLRIADSARLLR